MRTKGCFIVLYLNSTHYVWIEAQVSVTSLSQHTFNPVTESLSNNMDIYSSMFIFSGGIYLFLLNHVLAVLQQMVTRNSRNAFLHPTPLQQFFASQTSPRFLQDPRVLVPVVITEIFPVPAAYQSWWQLYNLGGIRYVVLTSAGLSWRFQHSVLSNWCNPPCFVWEVCLFVRFFMISMKETCIFQALLGKCW